MKEINFEKELRKLDNGISIVSIHEEGNSLYEILHSTKYWMNFVKQNRMHGIFRGYDIATLVVRYEKYGGIVMTINVDMPFTFKYVENAKFMEAVIDINEAQIKEPEFSNPLVYEKILNRIPLGGGGNIGEIGSYYSQVGLICEGHPMSILHKTLTEKIPLYFDYLTNVIDNAMNPDYDKSIDEAKCQPNPYYDSYFNNDDVDYEEIYDEGWDESFDR